MSAAATPPAPAVSPQAVFVVIPVYNNRETIEDIARRCRAILPNVVVVDDGSTDIDVSSLFSDTDIVVLRHENNQGKGRAIMTGLDYVHARQGTYLITLDADGQHFPEDIENFLPHLTPEAKVLWVGSRDFSAAHIPGGSRFGRKFAAFWLKVETGCYLDDCQSGFRAYPVAPLANLKCAGRHYDFEAEILARGCWAGIELKSIPIRVWYPQPGVKRVTSFQPFWDNLRLTGMHARLIGRKLVPWPHRQVVSNDRRRDDIKNLLHPLRFLRFLLKENATPAGLAAAAALGVFLGALPLIALHSVTIFYVAARLNLNKIMALSAQNLCMPPVVPALCIELGFYLRHGRFLTDISFEIVFIQFKDRIWEWLLGSLILGPLLALMAGLLVFITAQVIVSRRLSLN